MAEFTAPGILARPKPPIVEHVVLVDSRYRNTRTHPFPNDYEITLPSHIEHVYSVELVSIELANTEFSIEGRARRFYVYESSGDYDVANWEDEYLTSAYDASRLIEVEIPAGDYSSKTYYQTVANQLTSKSHRNWQYFGEVTPQTSKGFLHAHPAVEGDPMTSNDWFLILTGNPRPVYRLEIDPLAVTNGQWDLQVYLGDFEAEPIRFFQDRSGGVGTQEAEMLFIQVKLQESLRELDGDLRPTRVAGQIVRGLYVYEIVLPCLNVDFMPDLKISQKDSLPLAIRVFQPAQPRGEYTEAHTKLGMPSGTVIGMFVDEMSRLVANGVFIPAMLPSTHVLLCCDDLKSMDVIEAPRNLPFVQRYEHSFRASGVFAKVMLPVRNGEVAFINNDYVGNSVSFTFPKNRIHKLSFRFVTPSGFPFDFLGIEHTMTLRFYCVSDDAMVAKVRAEKA